MTEQAITSYEKVLEFYRAFKQYVPEEGTLPSLNDDVIPETRLHLKMALIAEEFIELVEAVYGPRSATAVQHGWDTAKKLDEKVRDVVGAADATSDLEYVIHGFNIEAAIPAADVFAEVHLSNMSKLDDNGNPILSDGTDGKPLGKILKGASWFEPDLEAIMNGVEPDRTPKSVKDAPVEQNDDLSNPGWNRHIAS